MTLRERCYRTACRIFRQEIIRDGFRGILGREPEEEALRAYEGNFRDLGTVGLIRELTRSPEAWEKQKEAHAEELIREAYQGILGRDPDEGALEAYAGSFKELGMGGLIRELSGSSEAWEKQKGSHAKELIREAYQGILGREPEEEALRANEESFKGLGTSGLIQKLSGSHEAWELQKGQHAKELIREAYIEILKRDPDPSGMEDYRKKIGKIGIRGLIGALINSKERTAIELKKYAQDKSSDTANIKTRLQKNKKIAAITINGILDLKNFYLVGLKLKKTYGVNLDIFAGYPDTELLLENYETIILGSDWNQNAKLANLFKKEGRKTILLQSEGMFIEKDQWYTGKYPICDLSLLWEPLHEDIFLSRGYTGKTIVTGTPRLDLYHQFKSKITRSNLLGKYQIKYKPKKIGLIVAQYFPTNEFSKELKETQMLLSKIPQSFNSEETLFILKSHPQETTINFFDRSLYGNIMKEKGHLFLNDAGHKESIDPTDLIAVVDFIITYSSTMAYEAALLNIPAIVYDPLKIGSPLTNPEFGQFPYTTNIDELRFILSRELTSVNIEGFVKNFTPGKIDGLNTQRAANEVFKYINQ